ncbi:hypothetical protein Peur_046944 [Populus x canadensis]
MVKHFNMSIIFEIRTEPSTPQGFSWLRETGGIHVSCSVMEEEIMVVVTRTCHSRNRVHEQGQDQQQKVKLHEFEPRSLQALHELVSLVHDCVRVNITDQSQCIQSTPTNDSKVSMKDECDETLTTNLFFLEDNPVAKILWTLDPRTLQSILLSMAHNFPRTLDALILHLLSPVGAEEQILPRFLWCI